MSAFSVRPDKQPGRELARIISVQLSRARARLGERAEDPERAVHETRRELKKIRAAARVARALDPVTARAINRAARDAGRALSRTRDADVVRAAAEALAETCSDAAIAATLRRFARAAARQAPALEDRDAQAAHALEALAGVDALIVELRKAKGGDKALKRAVSRVLSRADEAFLAAHAAKSATAEDVAHVETLRHEWRKRVKDVWHTGRLLGDVWPSKRPPRIKLADELGKALGRERDLLLLEKRLARSAKACGGSALRDAALAHVTAERLRIVKDAQALGRKLHGAKPSARTKAKT